MLRALGWFLLLFSLLSLLVQLYALGGLFASIAVSLFAVDLLAGQVSRAERPSRLRGVPLF